MHALIYERQDHVGVGALDIAGRPLLQRQLQSLRDLGIEDVVVEVCEGPQVGERAALLLSSDPLTSRVIVIPSAAPLGIGELARRAGLAASTMFVAVAADTLFHAEIDASRAVCARYELSTPPSLEPARAELTIESLAQRAPTQSQTLAGWGARVHDAGSAHQLGCAVLSGDASGIMVHGAELKPGVWAARGARIADDALVLPPALIGADAVIFGRARVGPRAIIGDGAVIERDALVSDAIITPHTIVGESANLKNVRADAYGTTAFADGARSDVNDSLVLAPRTARSSSALARTAALLCIVTLCVPWLLIALLRRITGKSSIKELRTPAGALHMGAIGLRWLDVVPSFYDVIIGKRDLIGINDARALEIAFTRSAHWTLRAGALDISQKLAPGASPSTLLRMWRWYSLHKSARLDRSLWVS
jgi:NDP-sugar pyrophosphorylase family protein